jgi:hypothetical protein
MKWPDWNTLTTAEQDSYQQLYRDEIRADQATNYDGLRKALSMTEEEVSQLKFAKVLMASDPAVRKVGRYFDEIGYQVIIHELKLAPSFKERKQYSDGGRDLEISINGETWEVVNAKWRDLQFTCADDFPFDTCFLGKDINTANVDFFALVNKPMTHFALISKNTKPYWIQTKVKHQWRDYMESIYECPKYYADFISLEGL